MVIELYFMLMLLIVEIPPALVTMRNYMESSGGFKEKQIFVKDGSEEDTLTIRDKLNREIFYECRDIHALAKTLIVISFPTFYISLTNSNLVISSISRHGLLNNQP